MTHARTRLDFDPYHDDEAQGVLFQVNVDGRAAQGYISCELLARLDGSAASHPAAWVALYRTHRPLIDAIVARRAPMQGWETVLVRACDLPAG